MLCRRKAYLLLLIISIHGSLKCDWNPFSKESWDALVAGFKVMPESLAGAAQIAGDQLSQGIEYAKQGVSWFGAVTGLDKPFNFLVGVAKEIYNQAAAPILTPIYENVVKPAYQHTIGFILAKTLDLITAGKIKDVIKKLDEIADLVQSVPKLLTEKTNEFKEIPDKLSTALRDLEITTNQIFMAQGQIQKQKTEVIAQDLKGKGIDELSQLHDKLIDALTSLEQSLALLASCEQNKPCVMAEDKVKELDQAITILNKCKNPSTCTAPDCDCKPETINPATLRLTQSTSSRCNFGILCEFHKATSHALSQAQAGVNQVVSNLNAVNTAINSPSLGYPSLPARIRAIGTILAGEQGGT